MQIHPFPPIADESSRVLILGSFPSVRSREDGFYYAHPANRFWRVIASLVGATVPREVEEKRGLILGAHLALWDVIASCDVIGSADSSITNVTVNDIDALAATCDLRAIFFNGRTAESFYKKYAPHRSDVPIFCLPSTSSANAAMSFDTLVDRWSALLPFIG